MFMVVMANETLGQLLGRLLKEKGMSQRLLAKLSGVDRSYVNQLVGDKTGGITARMAKKLADPLGVKPQVLMEAATQEEISIPKPNRSPYQTLDDVTTSLRAYIPVYAEVSAGAGIDPIDFVASTRVKPAPETMRAYRVKGLCLMPEIAEGDTLIVDTARSPESGDLVVVIIDGQASVKRFKESENGKWLENNNGSYKPEDVHIHGVVVEFNRKLR